MNALHQTRLIVGFGFLAALGGLVAAVLGRAIEPPAVNETAAVHVMWALVAGLGQLLAQCWIALFGWGTLRLLARRGRPVPAGRRAVLLGVPLGVVVLIAAAIWIGIQGYTSGRPSPLHAAVGWGTAVACLVALALEWRALETTERAVARADREA